MTPASGRAVRVMPIALMLVAACASQVESLTPASPPWTPPPDWVTVSDDAGSIQLTLPPSIRVFDRSGAIFASEAPAPGEAEIPIQLWAQGPSIDEQPRLGEDLVAWIERRLENPAMGVPTVTPVSLPAGNGIRYDRVDGAGSGHPWRIVVFVIETSNGAAWLMIDGPPDEWAARAADLERIPMLFRVA